MSQVLPWLTSKGKARALRQLSGRKGPKAQLQGALLQQNGPGPGTRGTTDGTAILGDAGCGHSSHEKNSKKKLGTFKASCWTGSGEGKASLLSEVVVGGHVEEEPLCLDFGRHTGYCCAPKVTSGSQGVPLPQGSSCSGHHTQGLGQTRGTKGSRTPTCPAVPARTRNAPLAPA